MDCDVSKTLTCFEVGPENFKLEVFEHKIMHIKS